LVSEWGNENAADADADAEEGRIGGRWGEGAGLRVRISRI
jgi:hypothetical protein